MLLLPFLHASLSLVLPTPTRRTLSFPRHALVGADGKPGVRLDSKPFADSGGRSWQVSLYPWGAGTSYAGRVGVYLKLLGASATEVDATFSLRLAVLADGAASEAEPAGRGLEFRCGMTFCGAAEALESVGRCEDWGAHILPTELLLSELADDCESTVAVTCELSVWEERACARSASLDAFLDQTRRLPRNRVRVGEVVVAMGSGSATAGGSGYQCVSGVEYRLLRLEAADGTSRFELDASADDGGSTVYLLPTSKAARGDDDLWSKDAASVLLDDDATGSSLPGARFLRASQKALSGKDLLAGPGGGFATAEGGTQATWGNGTKWPVGVRLDSLPPLASRLDARSFPARLGYAARTSGSVLLSLVVLASSPLWGGFLVSQLGSAYAIPSRSMEATLNVGDVVLAEKLSRIARLPSERGDLVLFSPPPRLQQLVGEAGGKPLGPRDLFVKRVAAVGGDEVELTPSGGIAVSGVPRARPPLQCADSTPPPGVFPPPDDGGATTSRVIPKGSIFVLGDCPSRSTDSRVWGPLPVENVVARPLPLRTYPDKSGASLA